MNDQEKFTTQSSKLHRAKFQLLKTLIVQHKHRYVAIVCLFLSVMYVFCFCFVTNLRVCLDHNSNTMMVISIYFLFYYLISGSREQVRLISVLVINSHEIISEHTHPSYFSLQGIRQYFYFASFLCHSCYCQFLTISCVLVLFFYSVLLLRYSDSFLLSNGAEKRH